MSAILLAFMLLNLVLAGGEPCTEAEHRRMQERFTACRSSRQQRGGADICAQLELVVRGCGEVWLDCHTPQEIRRLESMHVEHLREQWKEREEELLSCPLYQQIR
jgi:hypothetical protein